MGVYIKNMNMPTCCYACPLRKQHGEKIVCPICGESFSVTDENRLSHRLKNCPIIPVPEHGDLIDVNTLGIRDAEKQAYEAYLKEKGEFFAEETTLEYLRGRCDGLCHASGLVRFAPTIIHGDKRE